MATINGKKVLPYSDILYSTLGGTSAKKQPFPIIGKYIREQAIDDNEHEKDGSKFYVQVQDKAQPINNLNYFDSPHNVARISVFSKS